MVGIIAYMAAAAIIFLSARHELIWLFNQNAEVIRVGSAVLVCAAIFQVFDAMAVGYNSALRGAGDTLWPSVMFIITHWVIIIGGGFAVAHGYPQLGSVGPWIAATILIVLVGWLLYWRWHTRKWMEIDIFKHEKAAPDLPAEEPADQAMVAVDTASA
jgi:MATE family multidrug resistance protein